MKKKHAPNFPLPDATELMSYQIVRMIARGSSSFVYLAKNQHDQLVAIKEYLPHKLSLRKEAQIDLTIPAKNAGEFRQSLKTFLSEYRTLSCVTHPGFVCLIDFFRAHNTFYLVTNYEPGSSLKDVVSRRLYRKLGCKEDSLLHAYLYYRCYKKKIIGSRQVVGERLIKKILFNVIDAISMLHDQGFLYLDLKPANIYLRHDGTPFLLDFGAARRTQEKNRRHLNWVSTQGFAAPELTQRRLAWMGPWTDAYGIGATIFACMCGFPPQSAHQRETHDRLPQTFKLLRTRYSSDLIDLLEWCLHLDREQRPQTMAVLQQRLLECRTNHTPTTKRKLVRRFSHWFSKTMKPGSLIAKLK